MSHERNPPSSLQGRLAEVFFPALVRGDHEALTKRLGTRASVDDPVVGRAASMSALGPMLATMSAKLTEHQASYRLTSAVFGPNRDVVEGTIDATSNDAIVCPQPVMLVVDRRPLRQLDIRLYYTTNKEPTRTRGPLVDADAAVHLPHLVAHVIDGIRSGAVERVLAGFEETARLVDPLGRVHLKRSGPLAAYVTSTWDRAPITLATVTDDGRTCCLEGFLARLDAPPTAFAMAMERGDSGLLRELRLY